MSAAQSASRKRKRDKSPSGGVAFKLSTQPSGGVGPIFVSFPALEVTASTAFRCYARKKLKNKGGTVEAKEDHQDMLVIGETDCVEFVSNEEETRKAAGAGCRYLLAVHNPRTSTVSILPTASTPHILTHTVKALKSLPPSAMPSTLLYRDARNALGETFGTKKAKAAIRAVERNKIDVGAMEGVMDFVMEGIDKGAEGLMTQDEAKAAEHANRLIPPFDASATDPADVYPLHGIIPEVEWKALSVSAFDDAGSDGERIALLPYRQSNWLKAHLKVVAKDTGKGRKKNLKILLYISAMLAFRRLTAHSKSVAKNEIQEKLSNVPSVVTDSLLRRFTEVPRGSTSHHPTSATQTNLLTNIFALCLRVDNYATDTSVLAHDLSLAVTEVNKLFKSMGCKISLIGERERTRLGLADSTASTKRAVLNAPVEFPKPKFRRK